ncbi:MAG TPA: TonB family protein [Terriglobales bacterium]|jgi:TonB family protein
MSIALHCVALYCLLRSPDPIFVKPSGIQFGKNGTATQLIYFPKPGSTEAQASAAANSRKLTYPKVRTSQVRAPEPTALQPGEKDQASAKAEALAGSPRGSLSYGPITGHEVRPAFPIVYPDPIIPDSEIPDGATGDVVIEVTIDESGLVTATRVLQPFAGIEEKVVSVLRTWRFTPATMDGVAIPSQQDVHFHFPS